jgi:hypothetical protein
MCVVGKSFVEKIVLTSFVDHDYDLVDGPVYVKEDVRLEEIVL